MTLATEYKQRMIENYASALHSVVASNPGITAKGLRALVAEYPELAELRLEQFLGDGSKGKTRAAKGRGGAKAKAPKKRGAKAAGGRQKRWNVRSPQGREALAAAVLEALTELGGKDVAAQAIRKQLGATPAQIRTTLNRHIESGAVTFVGKARGTRYTLA